jgi:hypothetical protein
MDWSYVAGFFDGEGHASVVPTKRHWKTYSVSMANTHKPTCLRIARFLRQRGVRVSLHPQKRSRRSWKTCWKIVLTDRSSARRFLKSIELLCLTKRKAVRRVIAFIETRDWALWHSRAEFLRAYKLYGTGLSLRDVERVTGISSRRLRDKASDYGVRIRKHREAIRLHYARMRLATSVQTASSPPTE